MDNDMTSENSGSGIFDIIKNSNKLGILKMPEKPLDVHVEIMNILIDYMKNNTDYDTLQENGDKIKDVIEIK